MSLLLRAPITTYGYITATPLNEPRTVAVGARIGMAVALLAATTGTFPAARVPDANEQFTVDKWYRPLNEPPKAKTSVRADAQYQALYQPLIVNQDNQRWYVPLNEPPKKLYLPNTQQQATAYGQLDTQTFRYHDPLNEPPLKKYLPWYLQKFEQRADLVDDTDDQAGKWYAPLYQPIPRLNKPFITALQSPRHFTQLIENQNLSSRWMPPLNEPPKRRESLRPHAQQATIWTHLLPPYFWMDLNNPPKRKVSLATEAQQTTARENLFPPYFWLNLDEPPKKFYLKTPLQRHEHRADLVQNLDAAGNWFAPLSLPTYRIVRREPMPPQPGYFGQPVTYAPQGSYTTVQGKRRYLMQQLAWSQFYPTEPDRLHWHEALNEPVVRKFYLNRPLQQFTAYGQLDTTKFHYHELLNIPSVLGRPFKTHLQQQPRLPEALLAEIIREDKWYRPFSEPYKKRRDIRAVDIPFDTSWWRDDVSERQRWYWQLNEPPKPKLSLAAFLQQHVSFLEVDAIPGGLISTPDDDGDVWLPRKKDIDAWRKRQAKLAKLADKRQVELKRLERRLKQTIELAYLEIHDPQAAAILRAAMAAEDAAAGSFSKRSIEGRIEEIRAQIIREEEELLLLVMMI